MIFIIYYKIKLNKVPEKHHERSICEHQLLNSSIETYPLMYSITTTHPYSLSTIPLLLWGKPIDTSTTTMRQTYRLLLLWGIPIDTSTTTMRQTYRLLLLWGKPIDTSTTTMRQTYRLLLLWGIPIDTSTTTMGQTYRHLYYYYEANL